MRRPNTAAAVALAGITLACATAARADYTTVLTAYVIQDTLSTSQSGGYHADLHSNPGLGLGLAFDGGGSDRISLDYTDFDLGNSDSLQLLSLNLDHFFRFGALPEPMSLFAGGTVGGGRLDLGGETDGGTATHATAGVRAGAAWQFSPQLSAELGVRYLYTGLKTHLESAGQPADFEVNSDTAVWLGLSWHLN